MARKRLTDAQIIGILAEHKAGAECAVAGSRTGLDTYQAVVTLTGLRLLVC